MPLPGDPDALITAADTLERAGRDLQRSGEAVTAHAHQVVAGWTGLAAPLALARLEQDASALRTSAESVARASAPLRRCAEELRRAQADHAEGERMVSAGQAAVAAPGSGAVPAADAMRDAGVRATSDGQTLMLAAEKRARAADAAAAREIDAAATLLDGLVIANAAPAPPASTITQGASAVGNALASVGNAALHHPGAVAAMVGGGLLATVSAAGVVGGTVATATGAGAPVGVPLGGLSAAGVATGVGLAGAGAIDLALNAAGPDRVSPFQVSQDVDPPTETPTFDPPGEITGLTRHGEERALGRDGGHGVSDEAMASAVAEPVVAPKYNSANQTYKYEGTDAVVVLNEAGGVVTTWPKHETGYRQ